MQPWFVQYPVPMRQEGGMTEQPPCARCRSGYWYLSVETEHPPSRVTALREDAAGEGRDVALGLGGGEEGAAGAGNVGCGLHARFVAVCHPFIPAPLLRTTVDRLGERY